jgi:peptidoglycan hydrolase-like protein with peptidoglycan-binding domain
MTRSLRLAAALVIGLALAVGLAPSSQASPATGASVLAPTCESFTTYYRSVPIPGVGAIQIHANVPTTGYQNGLFTCRLGSGDALPGVFVLQAALAQCFAKIKVDGIYGIETENSVRFLQYLTGITVDGTYGPQTRGVMTWPWLFPNNQLHKCDVL